MQLDYYYSQVPAGLLQELRFLYPLTIEFLHVVPRSSWMGLVDPARISNVGKSQSCMVCAGSGLSGFKGDALTSEALELCVQVSAMHD